MQKAMHTLETKINEIVAKNTENFALVQTTQRTFGTLLDSMEKVTFYINLQGPTMFCKSKLMFCVTHRTSDPQKAHFRTFKTK